MPFPVIMPALELGQETGKLVAWRKKEGEPVSKGELLLDVETDKAVVEIEAAGEGTLAGVTIQPGEEIAVGRTIAWILGPGERIPTEEAPLVSPSKPSIVAALPAPTAAGSHLSAHAAASISPKARRLAKEKGVDVSRLHGSGPDGEVLTADVLAAADGAATVAASENSTPVARLMAERTTQSWTTVPHFFLVRDVDAGALIAARERMLAAMQEAAGLRPTYTDLLVALVARVLSKQPEMNASWSAEGIRRHPDINIGIAMAVNDGVVAAVIHGANRLEATEITRQSKDLAERARAGRLRPADVSGGTFTISNLGMYGIDAFTAIIIPPQAGILAVGRIADRVVPFNGQPAIRPIMRLTMSCDHRVVDGAKAAVFLQHLSEAIANP